MSSTVHTDSSNTGTVPLAAYARTRLPVTLLETLKADAARRRLTVSKLVRLVLVAHYDNRPVPAEPRMAGAYALARELNRIGVNLNQIAHVANATHALPVADLRRLLAQLEQTLKRI